MEEKESRGLGFCPDLQPDLCVGTAGERLLVGSQDAAHHMDTLVTLGVTHILNVAWGVPNAFPDVSTMLANHLPLFLLLFCSTYHTNSQVFLDVLFVLPMSAVYSQPMFTYH